MHLRRLAGCLSVLMWVGCGPMSSPLPSENPADPLPPDPAPPVDWSDHAASDARLSYLGRMDFSEPEAPRYAFPGVTVRFLCDCDGVDVRFEDEGTGGEQHTNFIDVRVDGESVATVALAPGVQLHPGVRGLPPGRHLIELVKRTEAHAGAVRFLGVRVHGVLLEPPPPAARRMEFIGDSITCGYGNEASLPVGGDYNGPNTGYHARNQDISKAYGALTARALGADWTTTCVSGRGVYRNNDGSRSGVLPLVYERALPEESTLLKWKPSDAPDTVVINLGTNDFAVPDGSGLPTAPSAEHFKNTYASFLRALRAQHPRATFVCAVGPMLNDNHPPGRMHGTLLKKYVSDMVERLRAEGEDNLHFLAHLPLQGEPYGEDWHPTAADHERMAGELARFLRGLGD